MALPRDGEHVINVYSKGKTAIGRLLSNFAHTPFTGSNGMTFASVEGWWYWFVTGKKYPRLAQLSGLNAKTQGKKYERVFNVTPEILIQVYLKKVEDNPKIKSLLLEAELPFTHFYDFGGKQVATKWRWTGELWNDVRTRLRDNGEGLY